MNITVIPNNNPNLYLGYILPGNQTEEFVRSCMTPIIGFTVEIIPHGNNAGSYIVNPIVIDPTDDDYFIFDMFTENWEIPCMYAGHGMVDLVSKLNEEYPLEEEAE